MQESPPSIEISAGISKPARRRRRTRHKLSPVAAAIPVSLEDPNDGDKDEDSDEAEDIEALAPTIPIVLLDAPSQPFQRCTNLLKVLQIPLLLRLHLCVRSDSRRPKLVDPDCKPKTERWVE